MTYDCPTCGKKDGIKEYKTQDFSKLDYANINIFSEDPTHSLDILYLFPPWRCDFCKTVLLRGRGESARKETGHVCTLCKEGMMSEFENAAMGKIVIRDTFEEVGELTIDEALICDDCGYLMVMETGKEIGD